MSTCCRKKAVLVAVYVETPRQRRLSSNHHLHHHRHIHLHRPKHGGGTRGGGYNRKAQLLDYSRRLRESAQSGSSSPLIQNSSSSHHQQPMNQIISAPIKRNDSKHASLPSCLGNLKFSFLTFIKSSSTDTKKVKKRKKPRDTESTSTKVKAIMKSFQAQKRSGLFSKFMAPFQKRW